jgi:uncharacterized protein (UPF0128 family)
MGDMSKTVGDKIQIDGREYSVVEVYELGENTRLAQPHVAERFAVQGKRGALKLVSVFHDGTLRVLYG